ncbi:hypothetical protein PIB30_070306 [Stylosanthes scabra]|uniref:Uncharacterized protein n=1 Tax=Stylosanthes scabra TaxID=79078 RepID=A0ABU6UMT7_9FABA|nr:hypothetical protein [Stylosanthes scabra]
MLISIIGSYMKSHPRLAMCSRKESHILQLIAKVGGGKMHRKFLLRVALQHFFLFRSSTKHGGYKSDQEEASNN